MKYLLTVHYLTLMNQSYYYLIGYLTKTGHMTLFNACVALVNGAVDLWLIYYSGVIKKAKEKYLISQYTNKNNEFQSCTLIPQQTFLAEFP